MSSVYTVRGVVVRIVVLILLIFALVFVGLLLASRVGMIQMGGHFSRLARYFGISTTQSVASAADPRLIEYERERADQERLSKWEVSLKQMEVEISRREEALAQRISELNSKEKELAQKEENIRKSVQMYENIEEGLRSTAESLLNMPPESAVAILLNMEDPAVVRLLNMVGFIAKERSSVSLVPVWLQLMPPERSASIVRKMTIN